MSRRKYSDEDMLAEIAEAHQYSHSRVLQQTWFFERIKDPEFAAQALVILDDKIKKISEGAITYANETARKNILGYWTRLEDSIRTPTPAGVKGR